MSSVEPGSVNLKSASINGVGITNIMTSFVIYEDIEKPTMSGHISFSDGVGLIDIIPIIGNETLKLSFVVNDAADEFTKEFKIYKITDFGISDDNKIATYVLHFYSLESETNLKSCCNNAFGSSRKEMETKDIVSRICEDMLGIDPIRLNIHDTTNTHNLAMPGFKPFDAIKWIGGFDRAGPNPRLKDKDSSFLFFETRKGFNFVTMNALIENKLYEPNTVKFKKLVFPLSMNDKQTSMLEKELIRNRVMEYEILDQFDEIRQTKSGVYGSRIFHVDSTSKSYVKKSFDYETEFASMSHVEEDVNKHTLAKGRIGSDKEVTKVYPTSYTNNGNWFNKSESKFAQMKQYKILVTVPGETEWKLGQIVEAELPSPRTVNEKMKPLEYYSGNFLVTKIIHTIVQSNGGLKYVNNLELSKGVLRKV